MLDDIQYKIIQSSFPDLASNSDPGQKSVLWIKRTAIKILQDADDVKQFDIDPSLKCLENQKHVNSEDVEKIKIYNKSIIELYTDAKNLNLNSYEKLWKSWGLDEDIGNKLMVQVEEYKNSEEIMGKIKNNFTLILEAAKKILPLSQN